jgi:hypothetical protein
VPPPAPEPDSLLSTFLSARDAECPVCSYNLRGLKGGACPECNAELHLQVGSVNLHPGPWILAIVSFALALGFDGVVLLILTVGFTAALILEGPPKSSGLAWQPFVIYGTFLAITVASAIGLRFMVRRRRSWNRMPRQSQRRAAVLIFLGVGGLHAAVGGMLFLLLSR